MDAEEREFLAALSDEISVWRGCVEANINGWSWTLDRERARFFAERFAPDGKPLIVEAKVRKRDVLAYFPRRGEEELVVHPQDIYDMDIMKLPPSMPTQVSYLYFLAQTGRLLEKEDPRIKAQMMANTAFYDWRSHYPLEKVVELSETEKSLMLDILDQPNHEMVTRSSDSRFSSLYTKDVCGVGTVYGRWTTSFTPRGLAWAKKLRESEAKPEAGPIHGYG